MAHLLLPALFAIFVWWFSTGIVLYLDRLAPRTFKWSMLGATILLIGAIVSLRWISRDTTTLGAYAGFACAVFAWAWQELSFYTGFVTGPRPLPCPGNARGWQRFGYALGCSLYHELAIAGSALCVAAASWGAPNQVATWTFVTFWVLHESARLNVFLGVANLNEEFLPAHMAFLRSYMTKRSLNGLFPVSVTLSTIAGTLVFMQVFQPGETASTAAGHVFVGSIIAVATLEHWFLVVPLPAALLWRWSLDSAQRANPVMALESLPVANGPTPRFQFGRSP
jgi:putative photosynthetic complex assembly protein 2